MDIDVVVSMLQTLVRDVQSNYKTINANVTKFVTDALRTSNRPGPEWADLFGYVSSSILFLWRYENKDLDALLRGLHEQSITTLHAYLSSPVLSPSRPSDANLLDPYKDVTHELEQLWNMKPRICSACHRESVFAFVNAQTRSADEGMTTFVVCGHCGHRHRLS